MHPIEEMVLKTINDYIGSTNLLIMLSILIGILMSRIVYSFTGLISVLYCKSYRNLSKIQKIEWNNRGFSSFHAFVSSCAALYLLLFSNLFNDDAHGVSIVQRNSNFSNITLGISIGYFLLDLGMILWLFPALGGLEYILHHGLSMFALSLSLISGQAQIYILMVLFSESTTPFVNFRWYLDLAGKKGSKLYIFNGIALFLGWLVARVLWFIFIFTHMFLHYDEVKAIFPLGFYTVLGVPSSLFVMNLYWFWKIVKGLLKTLSKATHRH